MKRANSKRFALAIIVASIAVITTGCGASNGGAISNAAGVTGLSVGGCVPISTAQIPITGSNASLTATNLIAGQIPNSQSAGQLVIGGAVTVTPVTVAGAPSYFLSYQGAEASVQISVVPAIATAGGTAPGGYYGYGSSPYQGPVNITGVVTLSSLTQQNLYSQYGNPYGYGGSTYPGYIYPGTTTPTAQVSCISGIALQVVQNYAQIFSGNIFLYMNNTGHGYVVDL